MIVKRIEENLTPDDGTIRFLGIWDTVLEKNNVVAPHLHNDVEEVYYILEGEGEMTIGDETRSVKAGDVIYIPPKKIHTLVQIGERGLRFITIGIYVDERVRRPSAPSYVM